MGAGFNCSVAARPILTLLWFVFSQFLVNSTIKEIYISLGYLVKHNSSTTSSIFLAEGDVRTMSLADATQHTRSSVGNTVPLLDTLQLSMHPNVGPDTGGTRTSMVPLIGY